MSKAAQGFSPEAYLKYVEGAETRGERRSSEK